MLPEATLDRMRERLKTELPGEWEKILREANGAPEELEPFANGGDDDEASSWHPVDLTDILAGTFTPEVPLFLRRADGIHLLYRGHVHSMHGESESAKSWVALAAVTEVLEDDKRAAYLDFESDPATIVRRLRSLGATTEQISQRFTYVRPDVSATATERAREDFRNLVQGSYALVVVDGTTDALGVFGMSGRDEDEVASFQRVLPKPFSKSGACVVLIDHVSKSNDERGRFAIGSQHKLAGLDGAAYVVEAKSAFGRGLRGVSSIRVAKDRPGSVRPYGGKFRASDRTQEVARFVLDETGDTLVWSLEVPEAAEAGEEKPFRPTHRMEQVSREVEESPGLTVNKISEALGVSKGRVAEAVDILVEDGYVKVESGPNRARLHHVVRPYREGDDPGSDTFAWDLEPARWDTGGTPGETARDEGSSESSGTQVGHPENPGKSAVGRWDTSGTGSVYPTSVPPESGGWDGGTPSLERGPQCPTDTGSPELRYVPVDMSFVLEELSREDVDG